ncbi:MAG TPA: sigma 54-interacting transcriptional regulator, partial [Clostridia bacterium]|nr:sigma 54-interacting transcriptional regulator [Clostridia bacterium]
MKKLQIVAYSRGAADEYRSLFERILKDHVTIETCCMEDGSIYNPIDADLIVVSSDDMFQLTQKQAASEAQLVTAVLTISQEGFKAIQALPPGTRALMVNVNINMSLQCIEQIYHLGATHIELIPYAPYVELNRHVDTAISPGETWAVPSTISRVIEIGKRMIDISTVVYVLLALKLEFLFNSPAVQQYCREIMPANYGTNFQYARLYNHLNGTLNIDTEMGLVVFTNDGIIKNYNDQAKAMLGLTTEKMAGRHILDLFDSDAVRAAVRNIKPNQKKKFVVRGRALFIRLFAERAQAANALNYMTIELTGENKWRGKSLGRDYTAKYHFNHIITQSPVMKQLMDLAEKNAVSESSILICGESGTGKELLAQAMHNASNRKNGPFVGLNCASLPESLLESELFGYEAGAFTGASRSGKKGLFEQADTGTLFLDEIGEMPIHLQTRLLRVLQEKEVMRIGGDCVIDVDVRIISATNRRLREQIREGSFRSDLYFRLNVVPLRLPPLRERPEDIPLLIREFQKQLHVSYRFTEEAMSHLQNFYWEGNIRELRNCVEYFSNWHREVIGLDDL